MPVFMLVPHVALSSMRGRLHEPYENNMHHAAMKQLEGDEVFQEDVKTCLPRAGKCLLNGECTEQVRGL